ncbi:hypothetical protein FK178_07155 [Antarcticibacterium arcticum]|uniref:Outer membrane protein beta-barrel domain-containing protein n=1 Tax=Antarcticibacterium arcticum TaxID=2585771 RepID=A0A5B8YLJ7_9FLAO|nr:hypothetical protein [Antarcticibacterium arcticum]QED37513.1 hypothetical protein FK178_07155 [Antarcticibacterium arcticum]
MLKNIYVLLFSFFYLTVTGQTSWEPGYIIAAEKDTISGFILERTDAEMARSIKFKKDIESSPRIYKAEEITGFGFDNGRVYESHSFVPINGKRSFVFAKSLVKGKIDLLAWRHPQRFQPDFFVVNNSSGKIVYLKKPVKEEIIGKDGKHYNKRDKTYLSNLKHVKGDSVISAIRFSEKLIQKDIIDYNQIYQNEFPLAVHEERLENSIDVMAGLPIQFNSGSSIFRIAAYFNHTKPERSTRFIISRGVIYNQRVIDRVFPSDFKDGSMSKKLQVLNLVPLAVKFQGDAKFFQPYGYAGGGIAIIRETSVLVKDYENNGMKSHIFPLPTVNVGIGARLNLGPAYLITELTPTLTGIFLNTGISF